MTRDLDRVLAKLYQHIVLVGGITTDSFTDFRQGELLLAALCYFATAEGFPAYIGVAVPRSWPFDPMDWRPSDRRGDLLHAAIFCILEQERRAVQRLPFGPVLRVYTRVISRLSEL